LSELAKTGIPKETRQEISLPEKERIRKNLSSSKNDLYGKHEKTPPWKPAPNQQHRMVVS